MKQMKFLAIAFTLLMSVAFTSCVDSDGGNSTDGITYVTVQENSIYGGVTLLTDDGYTLVPTNPELLKTSATTYAKRAVLGFQWAEGVEFDADRKKTYAMTIINGSFIPTKKYCDQPDTIKTTYPLAAMQERGTVWGANGNYLTAIFKFNFQSQKPFGFDLYPIKAEDDRLTMKLCQTVGEKDAYNATDYVMSFQLPTVSEINRLLSRNEGVQGIEGGELIVPNNTDSISVRIVANGANETSLQTEFVKIKIRR